MRKVEYLNIDRQMLTRKRSKQTKWKNGMQRCFVIRECAGLEEKLTTENVFLQRIGITDILLDKAGRDVRLMIKIKATEIMRRVA